MRGQIVSALLILLTNMKNRIIKGSIMLYLGVLLSIISFVLLGIVLITIDSLIGALYGYLYMVIIVLVPVYMIELITQPLRSKRIDWISIIIVIIGSGIYMSLIVGVNTYEPNMLARIVFLIPQGTWIILGLKNFCFR